MNEAIITAAANIVAALVLTLISVAGTYLSIKLSKRAQLEGITAATDQLVTAARITVEELQQTVVEKLKAAGGGKLTEAQIADLGEQLKQKTIAKLSAPAYNLLSSTATDIEGLIKGAGEAWIARIKASS